MLFNAKLLFNHSGKTLFDFIVTRDGSLPAILRIGVYVVTLAMTFEITACLNQFTNQVAPFHISTPISLN